MSDKDKELIRRMCIVYNTIMQSQPEDCKNQPEAMKLALAEVRK